MKLGYFVGLAAMWVACDAIISIRLYPKQSWLLDHSIRLIRLSIAVFFMIVGYIIL